MVTKLGRATGRAEYGLPGWFFFSSHTRLLLRQFGKAVAAARVSRPAALAGISMMPVGAAQIFENLVECSKKSSSEL
jgi:hypothetical protein